MQSLETELKERLDGALRIAVLGVGSELRGDDAVGILIVSSLANDRKLKSLKKMQVFLGSTAPENFTGQIKAFKPTHLLIIDCVDMKAPAGKACLFKPEDECRGVSFSTHRMPIRIISDYLCQSFPCCVIILGIQPKTLDFGAKPSKEVLITASNVEKILKKIIAS